MTMPTIDVKALPGTQVWTVNEELGRKTCAACAGGGQVYGLDSTALQCPRCVGSGTRQDKTRKVWFVREGEVRDIHIHQGGGVSYYVPSGPGSVGAAALYLSPGEAAEEVRRRVAAQDEQET